MHRPYSARAMADRTAELGRVRLPTYGNPWQVAQVNPPLTSASPIRLFVTASRAQYIQASGLERSGTLRTFVFDGRLRLQSSNWNGVFLESIGHSPSDSEVAGLLEVRYWSGNGFQPGWAQIPSS